MVIQQLRPPGDGSSHEVRDPSIWRRARRVILGAIALCLIPAAVSYVGTMLEPSNSNLGVRTVEWLRDHGASGLVSKAESIYYTLTAPSKGGPTLRALPFVGVGVPSRPVPATVVANAARRSRPYYRPPRIRPVIRPALAGEGVWRTASSDAAINPPVLLTTFRSESDFPRLVAGVAWINVARTNVRLYPGRREPSVRLPRGPMDVPPSQRRRLVATFNSGFKLQDARGGFAIGGRTYARMRPGIATFVRYRSGRVNIKGWDGGPSVPSGVVFARQNLPLIVNQGRPNPNLSDGPQWGATLGNRIRVWRSGMGVDRHGNLLYAAANDQTVASLANVLIDAGAVRAMELDINDYWVSFITYPQPDAAGATNLLAGMVRPPTRYLSPEDRDFFAVYARRRALSALR